MSKQKHKIESINSYYELYSDITCICGEEFDNEEHEKANKHFGLEK